MLLHETDLQVFDTPHAPVAPYHDVPLVVRGSKQILRLQPILVELCMRCCQPGRLQHLNYFFALPFARNKTPHLLLFVSRPGLTLQTVRASDLVAAVLTHEYHLWHIHTRVFATDDCIGRRTVIAPPDLRSHIAFRATQFLIDRGAEISLISYQDDPASLVPQGTRHRPPQKPNCLWASQQREFPSYLSLEPDFEATLANFGKRTRTHMRSYRRRAERELRCVFVPNVTISKDDLLTFNRVCTFPLTDRECLTRYDACFNRLDFFISGIQGPDGQWLSMIGGQKHHDLIDIYWQMNLDSLPNYSLSTVMRSFLIEHEVACGTRRIYMEGGTSHSMRFSFVREIVSDLLVRRKSLYGALIARSAKYLLMQRQKNFLSQLLVSKSLTWQSWQAASDRQHRSQLHDHRSLHQI
jgi:hypothetical protein